MKQLEILFEKFLWGSRLVVLAAVIASLLMSFAMFFVAAVDAWNVLVHIFEYASPSLQGDARSVFRSTTVAHVVEMLDGFLLATVLLIFALGLYELFISKIDVAMGEKVSGNVLVISSLDDLKSRLAKVILMILIVKFFEHAIAMQFESPLSLIYLAGGIALIGLALYLTHASEGHDKSAQK
ncbi:MAG: YqhA family protein [Gammaproteobacteria bacterium]|nr:YqhA family protein [Gammaproteobacteria bacterium]MDH5731626.1 YqhA family protein [Gammaproteobacteria bacterium]